MNKHLQDMLPSFFGSIFNMEKEEKNTPELSIDLINFFNEL